ncbi:PIN domain-containing protein [Lachnospiraceae bacterium LCP25S3_G4]
MGYYIVDYENVKRDGLNGINKLENGDRVCIFYSENADTLTFGLHKRINESKAQITFQKVEVGFKNALDFQLATFLGYLIASNKNEDYYIVSRDNGFNSICMYWNKRSMKVSLVADVSGRNMKQEREDILHKVSEVITDEETAKTVVGYIQKYKTKQGINNALVKEYKSKKGGELYQAIKSLIGDKKG